MTTNDPTRADDESAGPSGTPMQLGRSKLRVVDALVEAAISTILRPGRTILTGLGTILGVGTVVATLGIVGTANNRISDSFNAVTSTQITVSDLGVGNIPIAAERSVTAINGVAHAGISWQVRDSVTVASNPDPALADRFAQTMPLYAATPAGLDVTGVRVLQGRGFDQGNERRADRVALLGNIAAQSLGITTVVNRPAVFVEGTPFTVIGIIGGSARQPGALTGVIIPARTARSIAPYAQVAASKLSGSAAAVNGHGPTLFIDTNPGAAQVVGRQLTYTVSPTDPTDMSVSVPPDPATLRRSVEGTTSSLILLLAGLSIVIGIVAIANTTLLAVIERTPEIGLRRALGARPRHIASVTLLEASVVGGVGGTIGAVLGVLATTGIAVAKTWTAVLDVRLVIVAPIIGILAGLLAGAYPAYRATRIEPATALQRL
ncbi:MAG: ABC transporter permease [Actinobacteria bacterium]|nr:ABC transporter permease [Actinomycetota bacterium]